MERFFVPDVMSRWNGHCRKLRAIHFPRYARARKDGLNIAREYKPAATAPVEERPEADVVAAAEEGFTPVIPEGESKLAQQEVRTLFSPLCVSCQNQLVVVGSSMKSQCANQIGAIVKLEIS